MHTLQVHHLAEIDMNVSVILGHPKPGSFNHAIADTVRATLEQAGHTVFLHDLYAEGFDPVLPADEDKKDESELPTEIRAYLDELKTIQGLVFVHPNWWGGPPAILRGWIDRVFRQGSVYRFTEKGPVSFIGDKIVQVFSTSNTPKDFELNFYKDPIDHFWKVVVFGLLGSKSFERRNFEQIILSTAPQRQQWLEEVQETIARRFTT